MKTVFTINEQFEWKIKRSLLTSLWLSLIPSVHAAKICNFITEYYPAVPIEIKNQKNILSEFVLIQCRDKLILDFSNDINTDMS